MKVKVPVLLLSTASSIFIFTTLSFFIVWLGFPAERPDESFKDALTFAGSIFGGATTFGASIIAAYLFNDWRLIHNNSSLKELAVETYKTYNNLQVKLISINDIFVKSLSNNKIGNTYNISQIADDIESEVKEIGDLLALLLHQLSFIDDLANDKNDLKIVDKMHEAIINYMTIMDISEYRRINDHDIFMKKEAEVKVKFDDLRDPFINYLRNFIIINM